MMVVADFTGFLSESRIIQGRELSLVSSNT